MRKLRTVQVLAVGAAVALGTAVGASPASAAPNWQTFTTNSNWECGKSVTHPISNNIVIQTCIIRNANWDQQAVVVALNKGTASAKIHANVMSGNNWGGNANCTQTWLRPGDQLGCFGPTRPAVCHDNIAWGEIFANSKWGTTPQINRAIKC